MADPTAHDMLSYLAAENGMVTKLTPDEQKSYFSWALQNKVPLSRDYDMSGFWKGLQELDPRAISSVNPNDSQMHFPDFWKLPSHPTFSTESIYHDPKTMPDTPTWQGGAIDTPQAKAMNPPAESWLLTSPGGDVVESDSPFVKKDLF